MPLFFAIAGFLYLYSTSRRGLTRRVLILSKAKRLLVPYVTLSSLAFVVKLALSRFALRPVTLSWQEYLGQLVIPWDNAIIYFWFLPTLCLVFLVAPDLARFINRPSSALVCGVVGVVLWRIVPHKNFVGIAAFLNIGGALHNMIHFLLGCIVCRYEIHKRVTKAHLNAAGPLALVLAVLLFFSFPQHRDTILGLLLAVSGIVFCVWISTVFRAWGLSRLGKYSYQIYLFSWFPQVFVRNVLRSFVDAGLPVLVVLTFLGGLIIPILAVKVLDRWLPVRLRVLYGA